MFLTISTTGTAGSPATDLGFLLHKHPDRAQRFSTAHGTAHVLYPEATADRCTAALLLEIDPVALVRRARGRGAAPDSALAQYVNDRPYAASSLLAVALGSVFNSAVKGQCAARPELPGAPRPLRVEVPALPARGGAGLVERLFAPLGWTVTADPVALDDRSPEWGEHRRPRTARKAPGPGAFFIRGVSRCGSEAARTSPGPAAPPPVDTSSPTREPGTLAATSRHPRTG